jgi:hypothetical protein
MKEYRLLAWPEHAAEFQRTAYRRVLSEMSSRYMSVAQLAEVSGLKKPEVRAFLAMLEGKGLLGERDSSAPDSALDAPGAWGWLRRAINVSSDRR